MTPDEFVPGGGLTVVLEWATAAVDSAAALHAMWQWDVLDAPLRLALAQIWLLDEARHLLAFTDDANDNVARAIAAGQHEAFQECYRFYQRRWARTYADMDGEPCLFNGTEAVGIDMEVTVLTAGAYAGCVGPGTPLPAHVFITRFDGISWSIAGLARRLLTPGWPPTAHMVALSFAKHA